MNTLRELFDPGIVWHSRAGACWPATTGGVDDVLAFFGRTMELTNGTFRAGVA